MSYRTGFLLALALCAGGCVAPKIDPIQFSDNTLPAQTGGRVGVVMTPLPKIDTEFPGAGCLLCLAAAATANSPLTDYSHTLPYEDLPKLKDEVAELIRKKRGLEVIVIKEDLKVGDLPDYQSTAPVIARKDYSSFKPKYKIEKLVVINISALGFTRSYSAYIPTSDPKGLFRAVGYVINLSSNTYEWFWPVAIAKAADKNWDEPPKFPGLTNAYFQAVELGKDKLLEPLLSK